MNIFDGLPKSRRIVLKDSRELLLSTRADYITHLVSQGYLAKPSELEDFPELVQAIQSDWYKSNQVGCVFAIYMSADRLRDGWRTIVVSEAENQCLKKNVVDKIHETIEVGVSDDNFRALSIIYTTITSPKHMTKIIKSFLDSERFSIAECEPLVTTESVIPLKIKMSLAPKDIQAEPLCFGPFEFFALTRQAPFFEMVIPLVEKKLPPIHSGS